MSGKRILFLAQLPPPWHGQSVVTGFVHTVLCQNGFEVCHLWRGGATNATNVGKRSFFKLVGFGILCLQLLFRILRGKRYHAAYLGMAPWAHTALRDAILIVLAKQLCSRVIIHIHGNGLDTFMHPRSPRDGFIGWCLGGTELIALTRKGADEARASGLFGAVHHVPNFAVAGETRQRNDTAPLQVGTVGNLDARKGVFEFIETVARLNAEGIDLTATIVGGPTSSLSVEAMRRHVDAAGLGDVITVTGRVSEEEKRDLLGKFDIFLYPSRHDLSPLALIEAIAHGCVPVTLDTGGIAEIAGPQLAKNVLSASLDANRFAEQAAGIIGGYADDVAALKRDSEAAIRHFRSEHSEAEFTARILNLFAGRPAVGDAHPVSLGEAAE